MSKNRVIITSIGNGISSPGAEWLRGRSYIASCTHRCHIGTATDDYSEAAADAKRLERQHAQEHAEDKAGNDDE